MNLAADLNASALIDTAVKQTSRRLRVTNATAGPVTLYLTYEAKVSDGTTQWFPAEPGEAGKALTFELAAGEQADLSDNDWLIRASRVRLWAAAPTGKQWNTFKDQDLWLVPEVDADGNHTYEGLEDGVFCFTVK